MEGSVRRADNMVRVTAELVNATDSRTLWSQRYDRPYKDLFALQDDITRQVADAMKTKLLEGTAAAAQSDRPPSGNLDAYSAYLQGAFVARRNTQADMRRAIGYYEDAIRLDPNYALAYASLARAGISLTTVFSVTDPVERNALIAKARAAVSTALTLQPDLGRAHQARAFILQAVDLDLAAAEAEYRRAAELAPQDAGNVFSLGIVTASFGRLDEAAAFGRQAIALDPLSSSSYVYLARTLRALGRYDEAESVLRKALEINPLGAQAWCELAILQILRGNSAAAIELAQHETDPFWRTFALALAHFSHGDTAEADVGLKQLLDQYADSAAFQIAQLYAQRKDSDNMFRWLDRGLAVHDPGVATVRYAAFVMDYNADPRFAAFCRKLGIDPAVR
ncbi:MAG TPA: tetratricopeptide repeat protein [Rudaea sp.]|nr:tetratricopeptide repeat protein [Rudaea sp.]